MYKLPPDIHKYKAIAIGGSAGSFQPVTRILASLPQDFPLPIFLCLHRLKHVRNGFVEALSIKSTKEIWEPFDKESIKRGGVYLAPANYHMSLELGNTIALTTEEMVNNSRPSIDITLETAAYTFREKLVGILLSGANRDGALGMKKIKDRGGLTIVQDPEESMIKTMPSSAMALTTIDHVLTTEQIIGFLQKMHNQLKFV